jgi:hypothetical protein
MMKNYQYSGDLEIFEQIIEIKENVTRIIFISK